MNVVEAAREGLKVLHNAWVAGSGFLLPRLRRRSGRPIAGTLVVRAVQPQLLPAIGHDVLDTVTRRVCAGPQLQVGQVIAGSARDPTGLMMHRCDRQHHGDR